MGDSGYLGAEKKDDAILVNNEGHPIRYQINKRPSQLKKASSEKVRAAQGNRTCEILGAFQSGTCVLRNKENLSFLQNTIPRTGEIASALLHAVCTCEFIPCSQSNEGCVTRFISRANSALELRFFSKLWVTEDDTAGFGAIMRGSLRNKGLAQKAFEEVEKIHGHDNWKLDTILQEEGNCYLYEKLGYKRTGLVENINDKMNIVYYEKN